MEIVVSDDRFSGGIQIYTTQIKPKITGQLSGL